MYTQNARPDSDSFDLRDAIAVLRRRRWTLVIAVVLVLALGALVSYRKTPVYEATATLLLKASAAQSLLTEQASSDPERRVQNEAELVRSART